MTKQQYGSRNSKIGSAASTARSVIIERPRELEMVLEIEGTADLIQNCFDQKTIEQMLRKHMGLSVEKEAKKPRDCVERAIIRNVRGEPCIPPAAIKKGLLTAAIGNKTVKRNQVLYGIWIQGQSIPITYDAMVPRMDMTRTAGMSKTPDVRFRPSFQGWKARFVAQFNDQLAPQTIMSLLAKAGTVGVGEWRPEKGGSYGTYIVSRIIDDKKEREEVRKLCAAPVQPLVIPDWAMDADIDPELLARIARSQSGEEGEDAA
jgi:hypothetical protein